MPAAPSIANRFPASGSVLYKLDPICFDIVTTVGLNTVQIWVGTLKTGVSLNQIGVTDYLDPATKVAVYDGSTFVTPFLKSIRIPWGDGGLSARFQIRRTGGWLYIPVVQVRAVDTLGQEAGAGLG